MCVSMCVILQMTYMSLSACDWVCVCRPYILYVQIMHLAGDGVSDISVLSVCVVMSVLLLGELYLIWEHGYDTLDCCGRHAL